MQSSALEYRAHIRQSMYVLEVAKVGVLFDVLQYNRRQIHCLLISPHLQSDRHGDCVDVTRRRTNAQILLGKLVGS
jgi:hypothetical protein